MSKKSNSKIITLIISSVIILIAMGLGLFGKIKNGDCTFENQFCGSEIEKIGNQLEIVEENIGDLNFDE